MTRLSSLPLALAAGLFTLVSCDESRTLTDPEASDPVQVGPEFALAGNSWTSKAMMQTPRCLPAAGGLTNLSGQAILYAIGAACPFGGGQLSTVEAYNVGTNTWKTRAPLPAAFSFGQNQAAVIGKKIYVTGGLDDHGFVRGALFVYDQVTNLWTRKRNMPGYAVTNGVSGVLNGKLYVLNGLTITPCEGDCGETTPDFYRYDPATDTWISSRDFGSPERLEPCPGGHELGAAAVINGKFYVAGGRWGNGISNKLHVYDPATNRWTEKARPLRRRWGTAGVNLNGKLFAIGGLDENGNYLSSVQAYDPATNTWSNRASMPSARAFLAAVRINSGGIARAFVVGGYNGTSLRTNEVYTP